MLSLNYWALATGLCKHFGDFFEPCFFQGAFWAQEDGALKSQRFCKAFIHLNCFWRSCAHNGGAKIWECRLTLRDRDSHMEFSVSRFGLLTKISDIKPRNKKKPPKKCQLCISVFSTGLIFLGRIENCIQTFPISEFPHEGHQALHASNLCTIFFAQMFREVFGLTGGGGQQQMFCFLFFNGERSAILALFSTWIAIVRYASPCECASGEKTSTKNALSNNHTIFVICLLCHFYLRLSTFHPGSLKPASLEVGTWRREFIIAWKPKFLFHYSIYPSQGKFSPATSDIRTASQSKRIVD